MLFPTSLVGSYCQPDWLIDREKLKGQFPPRTRAKELWRIPEPLLKEAQDDATRVAIREQEEAGLDILTDGEIRRESYSNRFATALDGRRPRQPRRGHDALGQARTGAAHRRPDPPRAPGGGGGPEIPEAPIPTGR
jgi:methionine synthase II (cobalamin-independent)